jgi:aryl-alcohol dehydrogenase-like predicted oxidoreductase
MHTRVFGKTGWNVSEIGLGCWQIGDVTWGLVSEAEAFKILEEAVAGGVTFFDTADVYGGGRSEKLIGRFIAETKANVRVATKAGRLLLYPDKYTKDGLRRRIESSLRNLQTEALDLVQLHCVPTQILRDGDVFVWLDELQQEGLIRNYGASVESMEEALICLKNDALVSLQIIFNIFRQKPIAELFGEAEKRNVAIIVRLPLASGLLSGKFNRETTFSEKDHRTFNREGAAFNVGETFAGLPFETGVDLAEELRGLLPDGMPMAVATQRWILDYPQVTTLITGASRVGQASENVKASDADPLSEDVHSRIARFYEERVREHIRGPY